MEHSLKFETHANENGPHANENGLAVNENGQSAHAQNLDAEAPKVRAKALDARVTLFTKKAMEDARNVNELDYKTWEKGFLEDKEYKQIRSELERLKLNVSEIEKNGVSVATQGLSNNSEKNRQKIEQELQEIELETTEIGYQLLNLRADESELKRQESYEKWEQSHGELVNEVLLWNEQIKLINQNAVQKDTTFLPPIHYSKQRVDQGPLNDIALGENKSNVIIEKKIQAIQDSIENLKLDFDRNRTDMENCANKLKEFDKELSKKKESIIYSKLEPAYEVYLEHHRNEEEFLKELQRILVSYCSKCDGITEVFFRFGTGLPRYLERVNDK